MDTFDFLLVTGAAWVCWLRVSILFMRLGKNRSLGLAVVHPLVHDFPKYHPLVVYHAP